MNSDEEFTKIATGLAINARDLIEWGIRSGNTTADKMRFTVEARRSEAQELTKPVAEGGKGLSKRKAARLLGVDESTVRHDLRGNPAESAEETRKSPSPKPVEDKPATPFDLIKSVDANDRLKEAMTAIHADEALRKTVFNFLSARPNNLSEEKIENIIKLTLESARQWSQITNLARGCLGSVKAI
jgi:hypothetical protein